MVAAQNMVETLLGTDNSTKGKKVETAMHHAKQAQLSVRVSMIESLNEEIAMKLSSIIRWCQINPKLSSIYSSEYVVDRLLVDQYVLLL